MIPIQALLHGGRRVLQLGVRLGRYLIIFIGGLCQPKAVLVAWTLALQSQLAACLEQIEKREAPKPRFHPAFRLLWVPLSRLLEDWQELAHLMKPATVKRWHSDAFRACWR